MWVGRLLRQGQYLEEGVRQEDRLVLLSQGRSGLERRKEVEDEGGTSEAPPRSPGQPSLRVSVPSSALTQRALGAL